MLIFTKQTSVIKAINNKSDFVILFVRLFVYNNNSATKRINHRQHLHYFLTSFNKKHPTSRLDAKTKT